MGKIYHKQLGMIEDTKENRALIVEPKVKKDDTTKEEPVKQDSGNTKRTKKRPDTE